MSLIAKLLGTESQPEDYNRRKFLTDLVQDAGLLAGTFYLSGCDSTPRVHKKEPNLDGVLISGNERFIEQVKRANLDGVLISGNERFTKQVKRTLSLIMEKDPETYKQILEYVREIKQNGNSGMDIFNKTYLVGDRTAFHSVEWLAGTIAHDSTHSRLYWDYRRNNGSSVPADLWTGQNAELICNEVQVKCLEKIGAPRYMINYVHSSDNNHYDINKDGKYNWQDYKLRNW